jgi:protein ImuB
VQECELVEAGGSAAYLRALPVEVLEADGADGREAVSLLRRLGLRLLGDLAALPVDAVQDRFGAYGVRIWRQARGEAPTHMSPRTPPPDLTAEVSFEPPLDSVEAVCFSVRTTAERLVTELASRQLVATGVRIEAEHDGAVASGRTWLHPRYFSARDLVDRVHWQLQGISSLRSRQDAGRVRAPVERVRFLPEVVEPSAAHSEGLWGGAGEELVERGVARVQAMVGFDAVTRPVLQGGRTPADRQTAVPWGERATGLRPRDRPWPGRLPGPAPCRVFSEPLSAEVCDDVGRAGAVTERGAVTGEPARFRMDEGWQPIAAWAGPWPVDESWWAGGAGRASRFQVVGADGRAWLLVCGPQGWRVEAGYD